MKNQTDLILLHPPSVYDFREKSIMFGPMSDLVPSSPIFEMYPIGFLTIINYLQKRGISTRIVNLAYRMYHEPGFDVEAFIKKLRASAFGIDLHWLPHCQGSTEIAKIVKKYHPSTPVIFGGFSASYFYRELIEFEGVDFIIRGDSAEEPLYRLVSLLKDPANVPRRGEAAGDSYYKSLSGIPNLVYRRDGKVFANPVKCISTDLEDIDFDYRIMFKDVLKYRDIRSVVPFCDWFRYPITTIPVVRGCNNNCANCGGSKTAFELFGNRTKPAFRNPERLVDEISIISKYINAPVFLLGDLNSNGKDYAMEFFKSAQKLDKNMQLFFEFFRPPEKWFFDEAARVFKNVCYEISPDSHDEDIRRKMGKTYTNNQLYESISYALSKGALRFDLYFMTGLPSQGAGSILETVEYCRDLYEKLGWDKRFMPFISPMAPFLDPGSRIFENPQKFGYTLLFKDLKSHIKAVTNPSWKYILNYKSHSITADELVFGTYEAAKGLNRLKGKAGAISEDVMLKNEERIIRARQTMEKIDEIMSLQDGQVKEQKLMELKEDTYKYSLSTVCEKKELEFPFSNRSFKWLEIIKTSIGIK